MLRLVRLTEYPLGTLCKRAAADKEAERGHASHSIGRDVSPAASARAVTFHEFVSAIFHQNVSAQAIRTGAPLWLLRPSVVSSASRCRANLSSARSSEPQNVTMNNPLTWRWKKTTAILAKTRSDLT